MHTVERSEPTYVFSEKQVADKSEIARRFLDTRTRLNTIVNAADNYLVKRFYNIDHNTYLEGAIPSKYKELMGLSVIVWEQRRRSRKSLSMWLLW
jgi:hypothetical protein